MSTTALGAVQERVYLTLSGDAGLTALAPVYDAVPRDTATPYVQIGELSEQPDNSTTTIARLVRVTLHVWSQQPGYEEAEAIVEELNRLLDQTLLPNPTGWTTKLNGYEFGEASRDPDGQTRHIAVRYLVRVDRARVGGE